MENTIKLVALQSYWIYSKCNGCFSLSNASPFSVTRFPIYPNHPVLRVVNAFSNSFLQVLTNPLNCSPDIQHINCSHYLFVSANSRRDYSILSLQSLVKALSKISSSTDSPGTPWSCAKILAFSPPYWRISSTWGDLPALWWRENRNWFAGELDLNTPLQEKKQHRSGPISYHTSMTVVSGHIYLKTWLFQRCNEEIWTDMSH